MFPNFSSINSLYILRKINVIRTGKQSCRRMLINKLSRDFRVIFFILLKVLILKTTFMRRWKIEVFIESSSIDSSSTLKNIFSCQRIIMNLMNYPLGYAWIIFFKISNQIIVLIKNNFRKNIIFLNWQITDNLICSGPFQIFSSATVIHKMLFSRINVRSDVNLSSEEHFPTKIMKSLTARDQANVTWSVCLNYDEVDSLSSFSS